MAKINTSNTPKKNSNKNPAGTMPKDKITRFKLSGNFETDRPKVVSRNIKKVAQSVRQLSTYRMYVHGVAETKLPSQLRQTAHYFLIPMSRADSDNAKDRKGLTVEADVNNTSAVDNTTEAAS